MIDLGTVPSSAAADYFPRLAAAKLEGHGENVAALDDGIMTIRVVRRSSRCRGRQARTGLTQASASTGSRGPGPMWRMRHAVWDEAGKRIRIWPHTDEAASRKLLW